MQAAFSHIDTWIFDLDNTLYPASDDLFSQMNLKMNDYMMRELGLTETVAADLRHRLWREHGSTLSGLLHEQGIDPDKFLAEVHAIDLSHQRPNPALIAAITALPGRKLVYTNGARFHAERVTDACGLTGVFEALYGIEDADYHPKPSRMAFDTVFTKAEINPAMAAFFEDEHRNLAEPKTMGVTTVHIGPKDPQHYIDHHAEDLAGFLSQIQGLPFDAGNGALD